MDAMVTPAYVRTMAAYNAEMNRRLYEAAARIPDQDRRQDRGAFWGSLHGTLSHLLWGDQAWMSRFDNWPKPAVIQKQSATMVDGFDELRRQRDRCRRADFRLGRARHRRMAGRRPDLVQPVGEFGDQQAAGLPGDAFLQPPDSPSRPGTCAHHRLRREDRRHRFVSGGAGDVLNFESRHFLRSLQAKQVYKFEAGDPRCQSK